MIGTPYFICGIATPVGTDVPLCRTVGGPVAGIEGIDLVRFTVVHRQILVESVRLVSLDKEVPDRYVQEEIEKLKDDKKKCFSLMESIMSVGVNSSMLLQCKQLITTLEEYILRYDLLLYKTRISSYATSTSLVNRMLPLFRGSDEKAFTEVTMKFNYGGIQ